MNRIAYKQLQPGDWVIFDPDRKSRENLPRYARGPCKIIRLLADHQAELRTGFWSNNIAVDLFAGWEIYKLVGDDKPYTMRLTGSFRVDFPKKDGRCGPVENDIFTYRIEIEVDGLDRDGYVMDANLPKAYFTSVYSQNPPVVSCEVMARRAREYFLRQLRPGVRIRRAEVGISPASGREVIAL